MNPGVIGLRAVFSGINEIMLNSSCSLTVESVELIKFLQQLFAGFTTSQSDKRVEQDGGSAGSRYHVITATSVYTRRLNIGHSMAAYVW